MANKRFRLIIYWCITLNLADYDAAVKIGCKYKKAV